MMGLTLTADAFKPKEGVRLATVRHGVAYMGTNGTIATRVRFAKARRYEFAVRASGSKAAGEFPNIAVSIDGKTLGEPVVLADRASQWAEQTIPLCGIQPEASPSEPCNPAPEEPAGGVKKTSLSRWTGDRTLTIQNVEMLDRSGKEKTVFECDAGLWLRVTVSVCPSWTMV